MTTISRKPRVQQNALETFEQVSSDLASQMKEVQNAFYCGLIDLNRFHQHVAWILNRSKELRVSSTGIKSGQRAVNYSKGKLKADLKRGKLKRKLDRDTLQGQYNNNNVNSLVTSISYNEFKSNRKKSIPTIDDQILDLQSRKSVDEQTLNTPSQVKSHQNLVTFIDLKIKKLQDRKERLLDPNVTITWSEDKWGQIDEIRSQITHYHSVIDNQSKIITQDTTRSHYLTSHYSMSRLLELRSQVDSSNTDSLISLDQSSILYTRPPVTIMILEDDLDLETENEKKSPPPIKYRSFNPYHNLKPGPINTDMLDVPRLDLTQENLSHVLKLKGVPISWITQVFETSTDTIERRIKKWKLNYDTKIVGKSLPETIFFHETLYGEDYVNLMAEKKRLEQKRRDHHSRRKVKPSLSSEFIDYSEVKILNALRNIENELDNHEVNVNAFAEDTFVEHVGELSPPVPDSISA